MPLGPGTVGHCARFSCKRPVSCRIPVGIPADLLALSYGCFTESVFVCEIALDVHNFVIDYFMTLGHFFCGF